MAHIRDLGQDMDPPQDGPYKITVSKQLGGRRERWYWTRDRLDEAQTVAGYAHEDLRRGVDPYARYDVVRHQAGTTVRSWIGEWRQGRRLAPHAAYNQGKLIDNHILPHLGDVEVAALTRLQVQRWVWTLEEDYAPRYVRTIYGVLRLALLDAVDEPSVPISASPCVRIRMEPPDPTGREALTPAQVGAICSRCVGVPGDPGRRGGNRGRPADHRVLVWTLAFTGARVGELLKRDVGDWSPFRGLRIAGKPVVQADGGRRRKGTKKSKASKSPAGARTIEICPSHGAMLREHVAGRTEGALFVNVLGTRASYHTVYDMVAAAAERARADGVDIPEGFSPHWLRHTHKTWLRDARCDPVAVDQRVGHASPGMELYVHVTPGMRAAILAALEERWHEAHGRAGGSAAEAR